MLARAVILAVGLLAPQPLLGQSEAVLRDYFEGRTVRLKLAMPGTEDGVDILPGAQKPLDYQKHADRLKQYGTAIKSGSDAMVTKVKVKSKLIEFQLDGGGYGTIGDETSPTPTTSPTPKSKREQSLESELKHETDPARRSQIKDELDDLKDEREREDSRNRAADASAQETQKANIHQRRLEGGSRFNIRYAEGVPQSALTVESVKAALGDYLDFAVPPADASAASPQPFGSGGAAGAGSGLPGKGMLQDQVDHLLGTPEKSTDHPEGNLKVNTRVYRTKAGKLTAEFVEGVLVRYTITSE